MAGRILRQIGDGPHFRYYYQGRGVYNVFASASGSDHFIGQIETTAAIAFSKNPGKWRIRTQSRALDSMDDAALELLAREEQRKAA